MRKKILKLLSKRVKNTFYSVGSIFLVGLVISFALPPIKRINIVPTSQSKVITKPKAVIKPEKVKPKTISKPSPKPVVSYNSPPPVTKSPAPTTTQKTTSAPTTVITPAPSSSVNTLTPSTSSSSTSTSTSTSTSSSSSTSTSTSTSSSTPTSSPPPATTSTSYTSSNWAGYLVASTKYTAITADWVAPTVTGNGASLSADASWIGIGGVTTSDLIQIGTDNTVSSSGVVTTGAFYELLPNAAITITSLNISPGDTINASIQETSTNEWTITLIDVTKNQTFTKNVSYTSSLSSAEWIEEDPSNSSGNLYPLDNFGTVSFSDVTTTANGTKEDLSAVNGDSITMLNSSSQPIATPSAIGSNGSSFSVTRQNPS